MTEPIAPSGRWGRWLSIAVITAAVLAGGAWLVRAMIAASPGPLSAHTGDGRVRSGVRTHAELEAKCEACHPGADSTQTVSDLCLACHDEIVLQRRDPKALHSRLGNTDDCLACHTEHKGLEAEITHVEPAAFPHDAVGFALTAHQHNATGAPFQCEDCHAQSMTRFDPQGCADCHTKAKPDLMKAHAAAFGERCANCHDGVDRFSKGRFDHVGTGFRLEGRHARTGCEFCHRGVTDMAGFSQAETACTSCHEDAGARAHGAEVKTAYAECATCHGTEAWKPATFDHTRTQFPLTGRHNRVACDQCHKGDLKTPLSNACSACHKAPANHVAEGYGTACAECHTTNDWAAADARNHSFPIDHGTGRKNECKTCHPTGYKQYTCFNCHEHEPNAMLRLHRRETKARDLEALRDCVKCHKNGGGEDDGEEGDHEGGDRDERSDE
jgi:hypothetical protein